MPEGHATLVIPWPRREKVWMNQRPNIFWNSCKIRQPLDGMDEFKHMSNFKSAFQPFGVSFSPDSMLAKERIWSLPPVHLPNLLEMPAICSVAVRWEKSIEASLEGLLYSIHGVFAIFGLIIANLASRTNTVYRETSIRFVPSS